MKKSRENKRPARRGILSALTRMIAWMAVAGCLVTLTPLAYYYGYPLRDASNPQRSDAIVLFSHGQIGDRWLSTEGAQRTWAALELYKSGFAPVIVSSGSGLNERQDQAGLQAKWLERAGVPRESILIERQSTRTYESVIEVLKILRAHQWKSITIVTSEMDGARIRAVFHRLGFDNISFQEVPEFGAPRRSLYYASGWRAFYHATYEYAGLLLYKWKGWI